MSACSTCTLRFLNSVAFFRVVSFTHYFRLHSLELQ